MSNRRRTSRRRPQRPHPVLAIGLAGLGALVTAYMTSWHRSTPGLVVVGLVLAVWIGFELGNAGVARKRMSEALLGGALASAAACWLARPLLWAIVFGVILLGFYRDTLRGHAVPRKRTARRRGRRTSRGKGARASSRPADERPARDPRAALDRWAGQLPRSKRGVYSLISPECMGGDSDRCTDPHCKSSQPHPRRDAQQAARAAAAAKAAAPAGPPETPPF